MGPIEGAMRLRLTHQKLGVVVEMWRFVDILEQPAPRSNCEWGFVDKGRYAVPDKESSLLVATCLSTEGEGNIVFGILRSRPQGTWQFEIHVPQKHMLIGKRKGEDVLKGFEWVLSDGRKQALPQRD